MPYAKYTPLILTAAFAIFYGAFGTASANGRRSGVAKLVVFAIMGFLWYLGYWTAQSV